jgi:hypothetical protein
MSGLKELIILLNAHTGKVTHKFNVISIKISMALFAKIEKNPKIHMEPQTSRIIKTIWDMMNNVGGIISDFILQSYKNQNSTLLT